MMLVRTVSNVVALCATSALTGAMMLIGRVLGSYGSRDPSAAVFAAVLDGFAAFGPMVGQVMVVLAGLGALGLMASLWLDRADRRARLVWIGALVCLGGVGWISFVYEVPLGLAFAAHTLPANQVGAALDRWLSWHLGRVLLGLCSAVLAVVALALRRQAPAIGCPGGQMRGRFYESEDARRAMRGG